MKHWRTYLKYTITLALTCVVVGGALGAVNHVTDPIISARKLAAADSSRLLLFPDADKFEPMEVIEGSGMDNAYTALKGGEVIGHVGQTTVSGSQGMIDVISGIDSGGKVVGVIVGSSTFSETNGIGSKTKEPDFTDQFIGLELPAKPGQNVDTITGATISSTAVINATNLIGTYLQDPSAAPSGAVTVSAAPPRAAQVVKTGTAVKVTTAAEWAQQYADSSVRTISAAINAKAFFQNDEIESSMMKGYTLPGFRLSPTLRYRHGANASIEAGAYLLHYWGASLYPRQYYATLPDYDPANSSHGFHALPFLRARLATNFGLTFVLGDIYGGSAHGLIEPLYSRELDLTADPEAGIQMLYGNRWVDADMWADWRTFIFKKSPYCENFIYGISAVLKPTTPESRIKVDIPLQLVIEHIGGEIDTLRRVNTLVNLAAGASIAYRFPSGPLRSVGIEACYMASKQVAGKLWTVESGHALWAKASIDIAGLDISAAYYNDRHFCTLLGFPLFGDGSRSGGMAAVSAAYSYRFAPGFELAADAKAYLMDGKASFCIGAAANINLDFTLKKISR